jgi:hypothetical protein
MKGCFIIALLTNDCLTDSIMGVFLSEGIGDVWIAQQCNEKNGKYSLNGVFTWC